MNSSFWKSGHTPTLFAAFLYFDLSFMVWYLLGPLAVQIAADLHLTTQQRGLVVATPILAGAVPGCKEARSSQASSIICWNSCMCLSS